MKRIIPILVFALLAFSCSDVKRTTDSTEELNALRTELDSLKNLKAEAPSDANGQIATFLTFQESNAEEAMNFYVGLFENSRIIDVEKYGNDGPAKEGTILVATFELNGSKFACSDSPMKHEWDFTPGVSIWVDCKTDAEIENLYAKLSENGSVLLPLDTYSWSPKFAFVEDRFGVSWQLNLKLTN